MNYSGYEFLVLFPLFYAAYWLVRGHGARLVLLLAASFAFYARGEPGGLPMLIGVIALTYGAGIAIGRGWSRPLVVAAGTAVLLANLAYFKYSGFLSATLGVGLPFTVPVYLPLGISFFTFEAISYLVDLRREVVMTERSPVRLGLFVAVFPHLVSGPIMRAGTFLPQLRRAFRWESGALASGLQLFVEGFAKKRLIADPAGELVDRVFSAPADAGTIAAWAAAIGFTLQIYGDFSGYTDMGRGIARMLGFELPVNFDAPYAARSITDFWRRWHISLSSWLRDYLYIPLGGNRRGEPRTSVNLIATMLLGGLWHGAGWTFVAWGGYHGVLLALERRFRGVGVPVWASTAVTLFLLVNGWVLFRARDFATFVEMFRAMYIPSAGSVDLVGSRSGPVVVALLAVFGAVVGAMIVARERPALLDRLRARGTAAGALYGAAFGTLLLLAPSAVRPFIYFRF